MTRQSPLRGMLRTLTIAIALLAPGVASAQETATVQGIVRDAITGSPVQDARLSIVGTNLQSTTDVRGAFRISGIRPGSVTLQVRRIGYKGADIPLTLAAGQTAESNPQLTTSAIALEEVVVTGTAGEQTRKAQAA